MKINKKQDNPQRERKCVYVWHVRESKAMKKLPERSSYILKVHWEKSGKENKHSTQQQNRYLFQVHME